MERQGNRETSKKGETQRDRREIENPNHCKTKSNRRKLGGWVVWEWVVCRNTEKGKKTRAENEYCKHCFNLKQRCFQENEFPWSWAKNNCRAFLVLFCEWRASLFWQCRARRKQSPEIEVMPLCLCTSTPPQWQTFLSFSFPITIGLGLCKREASGSTSQKLSWAFFPDNHLFVLIRPSVEMEARLGWSGRNIYFRF